MSVRSRDVKQSAVVTREQLKRQRGSVERWSAWVVLFVSFLGSVVAFHGGWAPLIASLGTLQLNVSAWIAGLALQALMTFFEWHYFDRPLIAWGARVVDAATTALAYGPILFWLGLADALAARHVPDPVYAAWFVVGLVSLAVAWYPESRLVD